MTGVPVVPEELWMRTTSSSGTACNPSGYTARRSSFSEKGSFSKSAWVRTSATSIPSNFFAQNGDRSLMVAS